MAMTAAFAAFRRMIWRQLTSMRTALILLFLLALGSVPGALLPQWHLNRGKTAEYILAHPTIGPIMDSLGLFDVFASPWYSAIYLLLAISLVGCILPRSIELVRQWRSRPGAAPRNLARLPLHATEHVIDSPEAAADRIETALRSKGLRGWRLTRRVEPGGAVTISAERGYLREVGNLVFHVSVLGLLFAIAGGALYGYAGSNLVIVGQGFCSVAPVSYENFEPGRLVDGTDMDPFCVDVIDFATDYTDIGQALAFRADLKVQYGDDVGTDRWFDHELNVNDPLRLAGQRLYLLGHGYVPMFTVDYPNGESRDYEAPFQPTDSMFTSDGVIKITDPPGAAPETLRQQQLAIVGVFAPSAVISDGLLTSGYPALTAPAVAIEVYRGDLGLETGRAQNVFTISTDQVDQGLLVAQDRANLAVGESMTLDDGTEVTFTGAKEFVSLQTSYDPVQFWALVFAVLLVAGISASLMIKRRRVWYRLTPGTDGGPTVVEIGGLARTDQAGYGAEFASLVDLTKVESKGVSTP